MPKSHFYRCFGVDIKSTLHIPGLKLSEKNSFDIFIDYSKFKLPKENITVQDLSKFTKAIYRDSGKVFLIWQNIGICSIISGKAILINPSTGLDDNFLLSLIFGFAIAILFHQRGFLVLHANAVEMFGGAVLFLGSNGAGKSTTTITLIKKGYNLISDDLLVINDKDSNFPSVFSGLPQLKLWPEVIKNMGENLEFMPKINKNVDKRYYNVKHNCSQDLKPLKVIYLIEKGYETTITDLNSQKSLIGLIQSSYCLGLFDKRELSENFKRCYEIVDKIPIKSLKIKYSFDDLPQLVELIEKDLKK